MANFKGHLNGGLLIGSITGAVSMFATSSPVFGFMAFLSVLAGAIFPDVDTKSHPTKIFIVVIVGLFLISYFWKPELFIPASILTGLFFIAQLSNHRSISHKFGLIALMIYMDFITGNTLYTFFGSGLVVHYSIDNINPLKWRNWRLFRFKKQLPFVGWP